MNLLKEFVGKKVVVHMIDGFTKFGLCKGVDDKYLMLQYESGKSDFISHEAIKNIREDFKEDFKK